MRPITGCRIKFGPYVLDGPFKDGHHGLLRTASGDPKMHEALQDARKNSGLLQGFHDDEGLWVDRLSARIVAESLGQLAKEKFHHHILLFSEDFLDAPGG